MTGYSKGEWTNARYDICEIECDGEVYCTVATKDVDLIIDVLNENEQLKQQLAHHTRMHEWFRNEAYLLQNKLNNREDEIRRLKGDVE